MVWQQRVCRIARADHQGPTTFHPHPEALPKLPPRCSSFKFSFLLAGPLILDRLIHNSSMSRPIEFDRPKAVNRALVMFWRKGYQATSLTDLLETTDISRSSLNAAFKDKRIFYIKCLDLFADLTLHLLRDAWSKKPP